MDACLYDTPGLCRHSLQVVLVNKKQILFVPVLQSHIISEAAVICEFSMDAERIGELADRFFEQMRRRCLTLHEPYKNYWLMPKGIRSFKKYVEASCPIELTWDGAVFGITRWLPAPDRGFEPEAVNTENGYHAEISNSASPAELGELLLRQFDEIEKKRQRMS